MAVATWAEAQFVDAAAEEHATTATMAGAEQRAILEQTIVIPRTRARSKVYLPELERGTLGELGVDASQNRPTLSFKSPKASSAR